MGDITNSTVLRNLLKYDEARLISAETQLKDGLDKWLKHCRSHAARQILLNYLNVVQQHILKIRRYFKEEQIACLSLTNAVIRAYIEDTDQKLFNCRAAEIDAILLECLEDINSYKKRKYNIAVTFAEALELEPAADFYTELYNNECSIEIRLNQLIPFQMTDALR